MERKGKRQQWQEETIVDQNTKLYAKYEPITYSIEFDGNGADNGNAMDSSKLDESITSKQPYLKIYLRKNIIHSKVGPLPQMEK